MPANGNTNVLGQFTASYASTLAGPTNILTATCGALQSNVTVATEPGPTARFVVAELTPPVQNTLLTVSVTAEDIYNNFTPAYTGTVTFTSSDAAATLPANYTFVVADYGTHTFTSALSFPDTGVKTFTAIDTASNSNGRAAFTVLAFNAQYMVLETQAAVGNCMTLPNLNKQVGTTLTTSICAFHSDQVFAFGNDNTLRVMGYCVEVAGANYQAGTDLLLNTCTLTPQQTWTLNGNAVQSVANSNFCIDANGGAGSALVINTCNVSTGQQWSGNVVSPKFAILNPSAGLALDLPGSNFANDTMIDAYPYNTSSAQVFHFTPQGTLQFGALQRRPIALIAQT